MLGIGGGGVGGARVFPKALSQTDTTRRLLVPTGIYDALFTPNLTEEDDAFVKSDPTEGVPFAATDVDTGVAYNFIVKGGRGQCRFGSTHHWTSFINDRGLTTGDVIGLSWGIRHTRDIKLRVIAKAEEFEAAAALLAMKYSQPLLPPQVQTVQPQPTWFIHPTRPRSRVRKGGGSTGGPTSEEVKDPGLESLQGSLSILQNHDYKTAYTQFLHTLEVIEDPRGAIYCVKYMALCQWMLQKADWIGICMETVAHIFPEEVLKVLEDGLKSFDFQLKRMGSNFMYF